MNWDRIRNLALGLGLALAIGGSVVAATSIASAATGGTGAAATTASGAALGPWGGPGGPGRGPGGPGGGPGFGGPGHGAGIAGTVASAGSGSFTLTARNGTTYTVTLGSSTTYDYGQGLQASAAAVTAGEQVAVAGSVSGQSVTATAVHIQLPGYGGTVTAVNANALTIQEPSGRTGTMDVSGSVSVAVGQHVFGVGAWQGDTLTAQAYEILPDRAGGTVASVSGSSATVTQPDGMTVTVTWTSATAFSAGRGQTASASSVVAGAHIQAEGQLNGGVLAATRIDVMPARPAASTQTSGQ